MLAKAATDLACGRWEDSEAIGQAAVTKSDEWSYEREWRKVRVVYDNGQFVAVDSSKPLARLL